MHTFDALPSVQHPLAQQGETRAAEHVAFERLELVYKSLGLPVAPFQGQPLWWPFSSSVR